MKVLVTGCCGFIGSHFVKHTLENYPDVEVVGFSRLSDVSAMDRLGSGICVDNKKFNLVYGDLSGEISGLLEDIDVVINFAAKTFVDHSIKDPKPFVNSNIIGTYNLLEQARKYRPKLFFQISTDEVYGAILEGSYKEDSRLNPTNPYAATKAAADSLVQSYGNTYDIPYIITRTENNYGSYQNHQKVFPKFVKMALEGKPLPVYGDGKHQRMWLRVEDHCSAIWHLIRTFDGAHGVWEKDQLNPVHEGGIFHVAGEHELQNIELAKRILKILGKPEDQIEFIDDFNIRPGHDRRYALDVSKLKRTGWKAKYGLDEGIEEVVNWYKENL